MTQALIIFVRNPEKGKVKTRLAATLGNEKALEIYKQLLDHTLSVTFNLHVEKYVFYADFIPFSDQWKKAGFHQLLQKNADLGEKMQDAFQVLFTKGYKQVVIVGSDCIELTKDDIKTAFEKLKSNDVVIGPANDGGYYLLGMNKLHDLLFQNKEWSSESVYHDTINDINRLSMTCYCLPQLIDIDTEEDWRQVKNK